MHQSRWMVETYFRMLQFTTIYYIPLNRTLIDSILTESAEKIFLQRDSLLRIILTHPNDMSVSGLSRVRKSTWPFFFDNIPPGTPNSACFVVLRLFQSLLPPPMEGLPSTSQFISEYNRRTPVPLKLNLGCVKGLEYCTKNQ